jgi:hypothetical protein
VGISAYFQKEAGIDLGNVRGLYRTIEAETATYIIGSIDVPSFSEGYATHVYIDTDGWVLVYYLSDEPLSKIVNVRDYDGSVFTTKLRMVLEKVATAINVPQSFSETYYDFRYPNATHLAIIGESGESSFEVNLPTTFIFDYRGKSAYAADIYLNDSRIINLGCSTEAYGDITATELGTGQFHTFVVDGCEKNFALTLLYREQ